MHPRMNIGHEGVEMHAALVADGYGLEKQIHEHGLATPDRAPEINSAWRLRWPPQSEKPPQRTRLAPELILAELPRQTVEFGHHPFLGGIALKRTFTRESLIAI